jgi:hypothetical protein
MTAFSFKVRRQGEPLTGLTEKHYAPALVHAINNTIEKIQAVTQAGLPSRFTLRTASSRRLFERLVSISPDEFASLKQRRITGKVNLGASLSAQEGVRRFARKFVRFEFGGVATSESGIPFAIPTRTLRPTPAARVRRDLYPKALGVLESRTIEGGERGGFHITKRGKILIRGRRKTYAVDPRFHSGAPPGTFGVWQRRTSKSGFIGPLERGNSRKESETFKIWNYAMSVRYPKRLTFREDSKRIVEQHFLPTLKADLDRRVFRSLGLGGRKR